MLEFIKKWVFAHRSIFIVDTFTPNNAKTILESTYLVLDQVLWTVVSRFLFIRDRIKSLWSRPAMTHKWWEQLFRFERCEIFFWFFVFHVYIWSWDFLWWIWKSQSTNHETVFHRDKFNFCFPYITSRPKRSSKNWWPCLAQLSLDICHFYVLFFRCHFLWLRIRPSKWAMWPLPHTPYILTAKTSYRFFYNLLYIYWRYIITLIAVLKIFEILE